MYRSRSAGSFAILVLILFITILSACAFAQDTGKTYTEQQYLRALNSLDSRPFDPDRDPDIDMYINSWTNAMPFNTHGMLVERKIMTRCDGDPLEPSRKGAVLNWSNRLSRAFLDVGCVTTPVTLDGEQEIFYFTEGTGELTGAGETFEVRNGILALVPAGLKFTLKNTGTEPMVMYLISEPIPEDFRPNDKILVRDEWTTPYRNNNSYLSAHWIHNGKGIFTIEDGLGSLTAVNVGTMNAMTVGHAHSHGEGVEEVWTLVKGRDLEQLGREIRWIEPGTAFMIPPTGETPHSHINPTKEPVKFLLFARWGDSPRRP
ncbi:cupin domain-containing protein [Candidatus Latescibacterota bacterium]